jgi:hypothetical protein
MKLGTIGEGVEGKHHRRMRRMSLSAVREGAKSKSTSSGFPGCEMEREREH